MKVAFATTLVLLGSILAGSLADVLFDSLLTRERPALSEPAPETEPPPATETSVGAPTGTTFDPGIKGPGPCNRDGIRYAGTTAQGAEVCFTLTPDRSAWVEIGFTFVQASNCQDMAEGTVVIPVSPTPLNGPGRIEIPALYAPASFTATIHSDDVTKASGVFADSTICPGKKFKWNARLQP